MKHLARLAQALFLMSSLGLALFCLVQSQRIGHDQRARDLATNAIHLKFPSLSPFTAQTPLESLNKRKIGEESD